VSVGGGTEPLWAANGELFYRRSTDYRMMAVRVETQPTLNVGPPVELFVGVAPPPGSSPTRRYDVTTDGQRFLMSTSLSAAAEVKPPAEPFRVVVVPNWVEELRRRVPVD
jgi:hypothetical protein